jgi:hypothetical protein
VVYCNFLTLAYDVKVITVFLNHRSYPPAVDVNVRITHDSPKEAPMYLKYTVRFVDGSNRFEFLEGITPPTGVSNKDVRLVIDYHSFRQLKHQFATLEPMRIYVTASLFSGGGLLLSENQFMQEIDRETWVLAQQEDEKPKPTGIQVEHQSTLLLDEATSQLRKEIAALRQSSIDDPVVQLHRELFTLQINAMNRYLMKQPEFKQLTDMLPLQQICAVMKIDTRWAVAAALLASLEGYMKNWLVRHAGENLDDLKNKPFEELISKIKSTLLSKKVSFQQKKLSDLSGKRHLRNNVLHEMYVPSDDEIEEIKNESIAFVQYLESLIVIQS